MMKFIVIGCAMIAAIGVFFYSQMQPRDPHAEWKRFAVEPETKVRPARFEEMKFQPEVDLRSPASKEKTHN